MGVKYTLHYSPFTYPQLPHQIRFLDEHGRSLFFALQADQDQFYQPMIDWCVERLGKPSIFAQWDNSPSWGQSFFFASGDDALHFLLRWRQ